MNFLAGYLTAENDRRIRAAQTVLWLACFGPVLALAFLSMELGFGHPDQLASFSFDPVQAAISAGWLALFGVAAWFVGNKRRFGGLLGLALFVRVIVIGFAEHRLFTLQVGLAVLGIVLILRAGRALGLPFFPAA